MFQKLCLSVVLLLATVCATASQYDPAALARVGELATVAKHAGRQPVVLFDIDDTLTNSRSRSEVIFKDLGLTIAISEIRYHLEDTLRALGLTDPAKLAEVGPAFVERFFSNQYCALDVATPGAPAYVRWLERKGAFVVYLTGRDEPRMGTGTRQNLEANGFPMDPENTLLLMRPNKEQDELAFKKDAFNRVARLGRVVGVFENEPRNINAMHEAFPRAQAVFLDTIHSRNPASPDQNIAWVRNFHSDGYGPEVLPLLLDRVQATAIRGEKPVVLFDLDETLINSRDRALRILAELGRSAEISLRFPAQAGILREPGVQGLALKSYPLYLADVLHELGAFDSELLSAIQSTYAREYLSNDYCADDPEMPGASAYVRAVVHAGAAVVYISGRNEPDMGQCTRAALAANHFPPGLLLLKPRADMDDTEFKQGVLPRAAALGRVVGGFENEPANINVFAAAFPDGLYGFIDNTHSNRPDPVAQGIYWLKDFRRR